MEKKKKKVEIKENKDGIVITFVPSDSFVMPISISINFGKKQSKGGEHANTSTQKR